MTTELKKTELFDGIEQQDISALLKCLNSKTRTYEKDEFIFMAGESVPNIGVILNGGAQVIKENSQGDRMILRKLKAGDLFGETYASMESETIPVSVCATRETQVLLFAMRKTMLTCESGCVYHQQLIMNLMKIIAKKNALLSEQMFYLSHKTIRGRLEAYFIDKAEKNPSGAFTLPFKRRELAEYLCVDRSAMSRELGRMKKEGFLSEDKNAFRVNLNRLD